MTSLTWLLWEERFKKYTKNKNEQTTDREKNETIQLQNTLTVLLNFIAQSAHMLRKTDKQMYKQTITILLLRHSAGEVVHSIKLRKIPLVTDNDHKVSENVPSNN